MTEPARRDLVARRNCPFSEVWSLTDDAGDPLDLTTATVSMEVRLYGAQPGSALITLAEQASEQTEGLYIDGGSVTPWIDEAVLRLMPEGGEGQSVAFVYDLKVQPSGEVAQLYRYGFVTLKPGVTDRLGLRITEAGDVRVTEDGAIRVTE